MNTEPKTIIGICGNARCGKDTMAELIQEVLADINVKSKKINLADSLKDELRDFVDKTLGIDVYTDNTEEKQSSDHCWLHGERMCAESLTTMFGLNKQRKR